MAGEIQRRRCRGVQAEESVHPLYQNATTLLNGGVLSSREVKLGGENVVRGLINSTN